MADMKAEDLYDITKVKQALDQKADASSVKRQETYSGVTNASGVYTVVFATPYDVAPNLQVQLLNATPNHSFKAVVSATGFTVTVSTRSAATVLTLEVLLAATVTAPNVAVDVLVTAK